ncbi:Uncharacterised protein [Chlamydia trachomatis]|nr:Uncharacterised protein [Chlamydia trachomatis]
MGSLGRDVAVFAGVVGLDVFGTEAGSAEIAFKAVGSSFEVQMPSA